MLLTSIGNVLLVLLWFESTWVIVLFHTILICLSLSVASILYLLQPSLPVFIVRWLYVPKLISMCSISGIFQQYFVYQVQKIRLQVRKARYSLSDMSKFILLPCTWWHLVLVMDWLIWKIVYRVITVSVKSWSMLFVCHLQSLHMVSSQTFVFLFPFFWNLLILLFKISMSNVNSLDMLVHLKICSRFA